MKFLKQYAGMRRELYVLFWGRVVTNMGALIWPILTLILKNKMGYTAGQAANLLLVAGALMLPSTLIGGKLADRFNKRKIIIFCDLITVAGYFLCAVLPLGPTVIAAFCISAIFAQIEWPSYDALVADLSTSADRERAYSLNYLGANLGMVLAPALGGFLFENHLPLAFFISGAATLSSTILIFFFVKDISAVHSSDGAGEYELSQSDISTQQIFKKSPVLLLFVLCIGIQVAVYMVGFNFLMPLQIESVFGGEGAVLFGLLSSTNALVVILGTPLCTTALAGIRDVAKLPLGMVLQALGFVIFLFAQGYVPVYYLAIIVFTLGEVLVTLGKQPYIMRRVPASHRGRVSSVNTVAGMLLQGTCLWAAGFMADRVSMAAVWLVLIVSGVIDVLLMVRVNQLDKRQFPLLYEKRC